MSKSHLSYKFQGSLLFLMKFFLISEVYVEEPLALLGSNSNSVPLSSAFRHSWHYDGVTFYALSFHLHYIRKNHALNVLQSV